MNNYFGQQLGKVNNENKSTSNQLKKKNWMLRDGLCYRKDFFTLSHTHLPHLYTIFIFFV